MSANTPPGVHRRAYPFLVGTHPARGYVAVVAPEFLAAGDGYAHLTRAVVGDPTEPGTMLRRELRGVPGGSVTLFYRVAVADGDAIGERVDGPARAPLTDRSGRPFLLFEGLMVRGRARDVAPRESQLRRVRRAVRGPYCALWHDAAAGDGTQAPVWSRAFPLTDVGRRLHVVEAAAPYRVPPAGAPAVSHWEAPPPTSAPTGRRPPQQPAPSLSPAGAGPKLGPSASPVGEGTPRDGVPRTPLRLPAPSARSAPPCPAGEGPEVRSPVHALLALLALAALGLWLARRLAGRGRPAEG